MAEALMEYAELALVDQLIAGLEALIAESDEAPLAIEPNQKPRKAVYRLLTVASPSERKMFPADALYLDAENLVLRCNNTEVVRQTPLEVVIQAEKSGRGETMAIIQGKAREIKRIRGGYDIEITVADTKKTRVTPSQKLRECLHRNDAPGWNRWCQDIHGPIELMGMDLKNADLNGYDLCMADFTGSDFTGANLSGAVLAGADMRNCVLDQVTVAGTDLFRAHFDRVNAPLVAQSGMPELESVIFEDG